MINYEETEACIEPVVGRAVGVGQQLVAYLGRGRGMEGRVKAVVRREWHRRSCRVNIGGTGVNQVVDAAVAAAFEDTGEARNIFVEMVE